MWSLTYILSQVCMIFAVISLAVSFCVKKRIAVLFLSISNAVFYALHYLLLGEHTAVIVNFIGIFRGIWFFLNDKFKVSKKMSVLSLLVCLAALVVGGIFTYEHWYSFLPIVATASYTFSVWQKNIKVYRWFVIPVEVCGIILNILCKSVIGIILESTLLLTGIISIIRMYSHFSHSHHFHLEKVSGSENLDRTENLDGNEISAQSETNQNNW